MLTFFVKAIMFVPCRPATEKLVVDSGGTTRHKHARRYAEPIPQNESNLAEQHIRDEHTIKFYI